MAALRASAFWPLAGAAAFAAAELAAALTLGRFFDWGRAEALLFLAFRPWLLLLAAWLAARAPWRERAAFYASALALAAVSESLLLVGLGGAPWREALRGFAAGAALAALFDLLVQLGGRLSGRLGRAVAAAAGAALLIVPGALRPFEAMVLGDTRATEAAMKPELVLMTGLPLVWGEGGPFDPASRPAAAYSALQREFAVRPIDYLDAAALGRARLLLLAQPRLLEPAELVALDDWVRAGGRALILADPALEWPTRLPLGDLRRPPPVSLLGPLLGHWGLRLDRAPAPGLSIRHLRDGGVVRRLTTFSEGRFAPVGPDCRTAMAGLLAACAIGGGRALLVADADLLRDDLWTAPGPRGAERHARTADNPLVVASRLDRLAGIERPRADRPVRWLPPRANRAGASAMSAAPILALFMLYLLLRARRGRFHGLFHRSSDMNS